MKFHDPQNNSGEILPKAVRCGIFGRFSNFDSFFDNFWPEVVSDVDLKTRPSDYGQTVADRKKPCIDRAQAL